MPNNSDITTTVTIRRLFNDDKKRHGFGATDDGSLVYVPSILVPHLREGDEIIGALQPSTDSRSAYVLRHIIEINRRSRQVTRTIDRSNIVPRQQGAGATT